MSKPNEAQSAKGEKPVPQKVAEWLHQVKGVKGAVR